MFLEITRLLMRHTKLQTVTLHKTAKFRKTSYPLNGLTCTCRMMLQLSHPDQNEIFKVKRKSNVYMSHIENQYWNREDKLWTHDRDNSMFGQSGYSTTTGYDYRATGMFVMFPFTAPAFVILILLVPLLIVV